MKLTDHKFIKITHLLFRYKMIIDMLKAYYANNPDIKNSPEILYSTLSRAIVKRMNELDMKKEN